MMKRLMVLLLTVLLLLSACAPLPQEPAEIETEPPAPSGESLPDEGGEGYDINGDGETIGADKEVEAEPIRFEDALLVLKEAEDGDKLPYAGGEMRVDFSFRSQGLSDYGLAIYLLLDGRLQPFRTEEGGPLAWVHTIYPEKGLCLQSCFFTPTVGQTGDTLRLNLQCQPYPDFIEGQELLSPSYNMLSATLLEGWVRFQADPPEAELPAAEKHLLSWNLSSEELTDLDYSTLDKQGYDASYLEWWPAGFFDVSVTGGAVSTGVTLLYAIRPEDTLTLRYEICGSTKIPRQFSLLFLLDGQPVSVAPEDWISFELEAGKKTVVEAEVSLRDFENVGRVSFICVCLNESQRSDCNLNKIVWLSAADNYQNHIALLQERAASGE